MKQWIAAVLALTLVVGAAGCSTRQKTPRPLPEETLENPVDAPAEAAPQEEKPTENPAEPSVEEAPEEQPEEPRAVNHLVFMNGAAFTGTQPVQNVTNEDGTYLYEDRNQDDTLSIVNLAAVRQPDLSPEDALRAVLGGEQLVLTEAPERSDTFGLPAFYLTWKDEDHSLVYTGLGVVADDFLYSYYFAEDAAVYLEGDTFYREILDRLELNPIL